MEIYLKRKNHSFAQGDGMEIYLKTKKPFHKSGKKGLKWHLNARKDPEIRKKGQKIHKTIYKTDKKGNGNMVNK